MWPINSLKFSYQINDIDTDLGNKIIEGLKSRGWKISSQYSVIMFDKGIDYDYYIMKKDKQKIKFEWDNWFEWKIMGNEEILQELKNTYNLSDVLIKKEN